MFQERIIGNPRKSQGRIITRALLLSDEAKIGNKLELQIFGIAMRAGTHCAMPLIERFGVPATCRASLALYNTHADVDALARAVIAVDESHKRAVVPQATTDGSVASPHQYLLPALLRRFFVATKNEGTRAGGQWRGIGRCERHENPVAMLELS